MKVLIDTNVVVSAVLRDRDPETVILFVVEHPEFQWIGSSEVVAEYVAVLNRPKFELPAEVVRRWETTFDEFVALVEVEGTVEFPRDRKDAKFLACALAADAEYFVTGDRDFEEARKLVRTTILSVAQFKALVCDVWNTD